jgi:hypothetical protein
MSSQFHYVYLEMEVPIDEQVPYQMSEGTYKACGVIQLKGTLVYIIIIII